MSACDQVSIVNDLA